MASTSAPSSSVRCISSDTASLPNSMALNDRSTVPARANGVRTPATIATRRPFPKVGMS